MKMNKLLAGAAVVALTAGAANAQMVVYQGNTTVANTSGTPVAGDVWFADEVGSLNGVTVPLEFELEPGPAVPGTAVFASSPNVEGLLTVTFNNAVLDRSLVDDDIVGDGTPTCPDGELTVDAGGAAGQSSVTFRIADLADCDVISGGIGGGASIRFALPLILDGGDVDVDFELRRASNNALIDSGSWSANGGNRTFGAAPVGGPLITQIPALTVTATPGFAEADSTAVPAFTTYTGAGQLGSVTIAATGAFRPGAPSPIAIGAADVLTGPPTNGGSLLCTFGSGTGLNASGHTFGTLVNAATTSTSNPVPFSFGSGQISAAHIFTLSNTGTLGVQPQGVSCSGSVAFTAASGLNDFTISSFDLGRIRRDGPTTGFFEWVGDSTLSTGNVFRITGLGATSPSASVIVTNSSTGMDGEYALTLPTPTNGEVILNNAMLTNQIGAFGRADLQFSFHSAVLDNSVAAPAGAGLGQGVVVRRFMVGSNGTLFDMGDDNSDAIGARSSGIPAQGDAGGGNN